MLKGNDIKINTVFSKLNRIKKIFLYDTIST